jgi:hypothetical protein
MCSLSLRSRFWKHRRQYQPNLASGEGNRTKQIVPGSYSRSSCVAHLGMLCHHPAFCAIWTRLSFSNLAISCFHGRRHTESRGEQSKLAGKYRVLVCTVNRKSRCYRCSPQRSRTRLSSGAKIRLSMATPIAMMTSMTAMICEASLRSRPVCKRLPRLSE